MTYLSECLADTPDVLFPMSTYSSGYADSSGNSRPLDVLSGTAPASTATGPDGVANDAAAWGSSAGYLRTTYTQTGPSAGTYEFWFRFASAPAANLILASWCPSAGINGGETYVALLTTGKLSFSVNDGSVQAIDSPSALSTNAWHHVVCSWGTGGMTMRVDKSTLVTGAKTTATTRSGTSLRLHGYWSGASDILQTGAVDMAWAAFYPTKLTNTRTDIHYDAMSGSASASGSGSLSLSGAGVAGAVGAATGALSLSGSGGAAASATATGSVTLSGAGVIDFLPAAGDGAITLSGSGDVGVGISGAGAITLIGDGAALASEAASGAGSITLTGQLVAGIGAAGSGLITLSGDGAAAPLYTTDLSNALDGLDLLLTAYVTFTPAVVAPPSPLGVKVDKAIAYPVPVMVNGRPT